LNRAAPIRQTIYFGGFFPWLADDNGSDKLTPRVTSRNGDKLIEIEQRREALIAEFNESRAGDSVNLEDNLKVENRTEQQTPSHLHRPQYTSETRHQLGKFILPAVRLALDHINKNNSILSDYKLEVVPRDTQVS